MPLYRCSGKSKKGKVVKKLLGTLAGSATKGSDSLNISSILNNYKELTANDFSMELVELSYGANESSYNGSTPSTLTYNSSTGIITCTGIGVRHPSHWASAASKVNVYYLYVE